MNATSELIFVIPMQHVTTQLDLIIVHVLKDLLEMGEFVQVRIIFSFFRHVYSMYNMYVNYLSTTRDEN